jgi:hypothetical protein
VHQAAHLLRLLRPPQLLLLLLLLPVPAVHITTTRIQKTNITRFYVIEQI